MDTDSDDIELATAVATFLDDVDAAYDDYEQGYADPDVTLSVIMSHVKALREAADES
ncbi:uncharacterized protein Hqrw_2959 [Haloquadratum walsbyi C23]|uniref:Uncharacterized protein n=3 Tax=Haloquadratum walsbyi TaxID=293091 RepID=Q18H01_HALWD|nr:uncharacterized protein HQ_2633A [Haloquadratum walsbyi DSM 16790]CCC40757.1 uncharacterized protein Hqrw_2959 [Haloquadratum walsbyi C23]